MNAVTRVGVISDTHGLLRPEAMEFLKGCGMIIHCGDICDAAVLEELSRIAPVRAVRGNNDKGAWAQALPQSTIIGIGEILVYVVHDILQMDVDPAAAGVAAVLSGHSHKPAVEHRDGITYLNPGSAGPRRFKLPICIAELVVSGGVPVPRIVELDGSRYETRG